MSDDPSGGASETPATGPHAPASASAAKPPAARHRWSVRALLALGGLLVFLSIFAVWANRQLLNADNWSDTSTELLAQPAVQTQVAGFVVDQVYANVDVPAQLGAALPPRLKPLAGPAAGALRDLAERTTRRALQRPRIQEAWRVANRLTAAQLIRVIKGQSAVTRISGNAVILDLRPIVLQVAARLGLPASLTDKVPESAGQIRVLQADQLSTVQDGAKLLNVLATLLPVLGLACLAGAVALAAQRRRVTLLYAGVVLVLAGVVALIARHIIGNHVVDTLATTEAVRPAAEATWTVGTRMLVDIAQATIIAAIPLVIAALLAGPSSPAVAIRRFLAPWLRDRPGAVYTAEAAIVLLVVAWGPIPATRKVIPVLVMAALLVIGVEVLRRQTAEEFPDARAGDTRTQLSARVKQAAGAVGRRPRAGNGGTPREEDVEAIERLSALHDRGALSDTEFESAKRALLPH